MLFNIDIDGQSQRKQGGRELWAANGDTVVCPWDRWQFHCSFSFLPSSFPNSSFCLFIYPQIRKSGANTWARVSLNVSEKSVLKHWQCVLNVHAVADCTREGFSSNPILLSFCWFALWIARQGVPFAGPAFQGVTLGSSLCGTFGNKIQVTFLVYSNARKAVFSPDTQSCAGQWRVLWCS